MIKITGEAILTVTGGTIVNSSFVAISTPVEIWVTKMDDNIDKPLIAIPIPRSKSTMDSSTEPDTILVDIGKINEIIAVQGFLIDESGSAAFVKKTNFKKIVKFYRTVKVTWGTGSRIQTFYGNINKVGITETAGIIGEQATGYEAEKNFSIQFSLTVGTDK